MNRPICVQIAALGGQGGGVLTDWLVEAARKAGYPAEATSIPGVAQRTGATTYYFELFPERNPPADPVFCLFPDAGELDLMVALEPTEAGRALARALISKDTVVITSTDRLYSTAEKMAAADGRVDLNAILRALESSAKKLIQFATPRDSEEQLNAIMLGAIAASAVLPLSEADYRGAIEAKGVAVASNLAGFERGLALARDAGQATPAEPHPIYDPAPAGFEAELARFPDPLHPLVGHALGRMVDYQDRDYARRYLERLRRILDADLAADGAEKGYRLSRIVAERLAAWMSYEDVIRVAQLKTRPGRIARIRSEVGARLDEPVEIIDYLKPAREEFMGLIPARMDWIVPASSRLTRGIPMRIRASSPWGYAALKMLAAMRKVRRLTTRFAREQQVIDAWLAAVIGAAAANYDLACRAAELAIWARGYGKVRTRGLAAIENVLGAFPRRLARGADALKAEVERSLYVARNDPDAACKPWPDRSRLGSRTSVRDEPRLAEGRGRPANL